MSVQPVRDGVPGPDGAVGPAPRGFIEALAVPATDAIADRRSRRVGLGMHADTPSLQYESTYLPVPLDPLEEAMLVSAGAGVSGPSLRDLGHPDGLGALVRWSGRSFPSPCNNQGTALFLSNDAGTFFVDTERLAPSGSSPSDVNEAAAELVERYQGALIRTADGRAELPTGPPGLFEFNAWNANQPGTTLFVPVTDMTEEYLNVLLVYLGEEQRVTIVDELLGGQPAGLGPWVSSGRLDGERRMSIFQFEQRLLGIKATEAAFICQNIALVQQCLGLGGFTFSAYNSRWALGGLDVPGLGFRFLQDRAGEPYPVGKDGIFEALTPPYAKDADAAVDGFLAKKLGARPQGLSGRMPDPDDTTVEMMKAYYDHALEQYGRFPVYLDPMYMRIVCQAHHIDLDYYDEHGPAEAVTELHRRHFSDWHPHLCDEHGRPPRADTG
jgi:hypothetical protein